MSEDDLAAEHIDSVHWWQPRELADYRGSDLFAPATSPPC
ncbi:hypothetical protein FRACA_920023 [Frankia canadensis]|uniref:Uncharacterized protein n=1 Tax=Frankia canadensis TaxID=1836972 RepID=A0A2I2L2I2_9ACTN|nr:hypothetical protein FRACA_920023 [Frankia canadensis]SOU59420.1 hypothetical protein FRACA_920023 [Frankia canadensis]